MKIEVQGVEVEVYRKGENSNRVIKVNTIPFEIFTNKGDSDGLPNTVTTRRDS